MAKRKKQAVAQMHPRQKLTDKAFWAIETYVRIKCKGCTILIWAVKFSLEADHMPRERLYEFLESKGYQWTGRRGAWQKRIGSDKL